MKTAKLLKAILDQPDKAISHVGLIYVYDKDLSIIRVGNQLPFIYQLRNGKKITTKEELDRISSLSIPPGWDKVCITHLVNGHIQAVGRDKKSRKQYRYHPLWIELRNQTKFFKMAEFGKVLPKIRMQVDKDLTLSGWPERKVLALILKLMEETHIRIGNEQYAKRNKTYGLTTLRDRHVTIYKDKLRFEFVGKKGKRHKVTIRNKKLIRLVSKCEEIPGWELFQFFDDKGVKQSVDSTMVNSYIHSISGDLFTAKDFRTWAGSLIFFENLYEIGMPKNPGEAKKNMIRAVDLTAAELGNSRSICKKYYIHPLLFSMYEDGSMGGEFKKLDKGSATTPYFSETERILLKIYKEYQPLDQLMER